MQRCSKKADGKRKNIQRHMPRRTGFAFESECESESESEYAAESESESMESRSRTQRAQGMPGNANSSKCIWRCCDLISIFPLSVCVDFQFLFASASFCLGFASLPFPGFSPSNLIIIRMQRLLASAKMSFESWKTQRCCLPTSASV